MQSTMKFWKFLVVFVFSLFLLPALIQAQHYTQKNLVSDIPQPNNADGTKVVVDPNLKNPWGFTRSSGSPWWVANNNSGTSTLYDGNGNPYPPPSKGGPLVVTVPRGFAAFNVQNIGGTLFVTYAKQDAPRHDPVGGDGLGFVEIFSPSGKHIGHLEHGDWFSNAILVGNFRSGWIAAFNGFTHKFIGFMKSPDDSLLTIGGLWSLTFGNDATAGLANTLYFTAGINNETDGLLGTLTPIDGLDGDEE